MKLQTPNFNLSKPSVAGLILLLIAGVEFLDFATGPDLDVSFLLLLPISLAAWRLGRWPSQATAFLCAASVLATEYMDHDIIIHPFVTMWNTGALMVFLAAFGWVLDAFHRQHLSQIEMAQTDPLTGLRNRRAFLLALESEIARQTRTHRTFTLAYIDLDRFKWVNDHHGHAAGDVLLASFARILNAAFRGTDVTARLGGDEFVVLLPETGEEAAHNRFASLEAEFRGLFLGQGYPVSASIGILPCGNGPQTVSQVLEEADRRMYEVKEKKKREPPAG